MQWWDGDEDGDEDENGMRRNWLTHLINAGIKTSITSHSAEVGIRNWILSVGGHRNEQESE
jgi:hypothetical protein